MLAERAALAWLEVHLADERLSGRWDRLDLAEAAHLDRSRDRAQERFLAAPKTLATVRKPAVPVLQVNVAQNMVNQVHPPGVASPRTPPAY